MGKYMRNPKITGDVAVVELVPKSFALGVQTRAKTLALQRRQSTATPPQCESSYLQLRSRRLAKLPPLPNPTKKKQQQQSCPQIGCRVNRSPNSGANPNSRSVPRSLNSGSIGSEPISCTKNEEGIMLQFMARTSEEDEPSFGENNLEFDGRERSTRESTPCNFVKESDAAGTPGSTSKQTGATANTRRIRNSRQGNIPTTQEMEEFFACAQQQQERRFTEKYNFDVVSDLPLPGRYEWVRVQR